MDEASQIRRLNRFNYFYLALVILGLIVLLGNRLSTSIEASRNTVRVEWQADGGLRVGSSSDGPFVITTLTFSSSPEVIAQLPKPLVIIESGGVYLTKQEVDSLVWYERTSREESAAPLKGSPIRALYYKALRTEPAK